MAFLRATPHPHQVRVLRDAPRAAMLTSDAHDKKEFLQRLASGIVLAHNLPVNH